eukprot:CAMPEP_0174840514 /NCGR_PEP_ID=MMETSP1114-20130205/8725_1 /TAXON_ID=312471 /ORGANISM="Neobodo designis, Strain CCAP 1951/1" /LENGTH=459 /DNA_ID=CAMNT_0016074667 /DNA_START=454 /DNA_END=1830 /DNA_ORIENTATION=+
MMQSSVATANPLRPRDPHPPAGTPTGAPWPTLRRWQAVLAADEDAPFPDGIAAQITQALAAAVPSSDHPPDKNVSSAPKQTAHTPSDMATSNPGSADEQQLTPSSEGSRGIRPWLAAADGLVRVLCPHSDVPTPSSATPARSAESASLDHPATAAHPKRSAPCCQPLRHALRYLLATVLQAEAAGGAALGSTAEQTSMSSSANDHPAPGPKPTMPPRRRSTRNYESPFVALQVLATPQMGPSSAPSAVMSPPDALASVTSPGALISRPAGSVVLWRRATSRRSVLASNLAGSPSAAITTAALAAQRERARQRTRRTTSDGSTSAAAAAAAVHMSAGLNSLQNATSLSDQEDRWMRSATSLADDSEMLPSAATQPQLLVRGSSLGTTAMSTMLRSPVIGAEDDDVASPTSAAAAVPHTATAALVDDGFTLGELNQYVLLQTLGQGAQGEVFLAMDTVANE